MSQSSTPENERQQLRLKQAISEFMVRSRGGVKVDRESFIAKYADVADGLRRFFAMESRTNSAGATSTPQSTSSNFPLPVSPIKPGPLPAPPPPPKGLPISRPPSLSSGTPLLPPSVLSNSQPSGGARSPEQPRQGSVGPSAPLPAPPLPKMFSTPALSTPKAPGTNPSVSSDPESLKASHGQLPTQQSPVNRSCAIDSLPLSPPPMNQIKSVGVIPPQQTVPSSSAANQNTASTVDFQGAAIGNQNGPSTTVSNPMNVDPGRKGQRLGNFELIDIIGKGGFGTVFRARQMSMSGRIVAVKILTAGNAATKTNIQRFLGDAEKAGKLQHPNIIRVYDQGRDGQTFFFAMEYIAGQTLAHMLRSGPLLPEIAARYVEIVSRAVHVAHEHSILHRDLKPANILVNRADEPIVTDFGLAKKIDDSDKNTLTGELIGTLHYMSPEQAAGDNEAIDQRSDIYSLGVILYELITGKPPFLGQTPVATLDMVRYLDPILPSRLNSRVPFDLETICLKCLEKNPTARYRSAVELAEDLARYRRGEPVFARRIGRAELAWRWIKRRPLVTGTLAFSAIAVLFAVLLFSELRTAPVDKEIAALLTAESKNVAEILDHLQAFGPVAHQRLQKLAENRELTAEKQVRVRLGLLCFDPKVAGRLSDDMLKQEDRSEFFLIRSKLVPHMREIVGDLWRSAEDTNLSENLRFRAACALAVLDPVNQSAWTAIRDRFVDNLLSYGESDAIGWLESADAFRPTLATALSQAFRRSDASPTSKNTAARLLILCSAGQTAELADVIADADIEQFAMLMKPLAADRSAKSESIRRIVAHFPSLGVDEGEPTLVGRNQERMSEKFTGLVSRKVRAIVALSILGEQSYLWAAFNQTRFQDVRTALIHEMPLLNLDPEILINRLIRTPQETSPQARRGIILSLGEYGDGAMSKDAKAEVAAFLMREYELNPDPGTHAAIGWTLRRWGQGAHLNETDNLRREYSDSDPRRWYSNSLGQTMSIIEPVDFWMGKPGLNYAGGNEQNDKKNLPKHRRKISRTFAIATSEVRLDDFVKFRDETRLLSDHLFKRTDNNSEMESPVLYVTWNEAARFCRWLSEREGIPEDQMCYKPPQADGLCEAYPDALLRTGYRLPTNAEWEFACRGRSETERFFGDDISQINRYAWTSSQSANHSWPVMTLKPNDFGLFDVFGNAAEYCHDFYLSPRAIFDVSFYGTMNKFIDDVGGGDTMKNRSVRGGAFDLPAFDLRATEVARVESRMFRSPNIGFRVARTLKVDRSLNPQSSSVSFLQDGEEPYDVSSLKTIGEFATADYDRLCLRVTELLELAEDNSDDKKITNYFKHDILKEHIANAPALAKRRLGALLKSDGNAVVTLMYMPFSTEQEAIEAVRPLFPLQERRPNEIFRLHGSFPWFLRFAKGYAFVADTRSQLLPEYLPDMKNLLLLRQLPEDDIFITLRLDEIFKFPSFSRSSATMSNIFTDAKTLNIGLGKLHPGSGSKIDVSLEGSAGSPLTKTLSNWKNGPSRFNVLRTEASAFKLALTLRFDDWLKHELLRAVTEQPDEDLLMNIPSPFADVLRNFAQDEVSRALVLELLKNLIQEGLIDCASVINQDRQIVAMHLPRAEELERRFLEGLERSGSPPIRPTAERNGWRIYPFESTAVPSDPSDRSNSRTTIGWGFSKDGLIFYQGNNGISQLDKVLDEIPPLNRLVGPPVAPFLEELSVRRFFVELAKNEQNPLTEFFGNSNWERSLEKDDHIRIEIGPADGKLKGQVEIGLGVLRFFGKMVAEVIQKAYGPQNRSLP